MRPGFYAKRRKSTNSADSFSLQTNDRDLSQQIILCLRGFVVKILARKFSSDLSSKEPKFK